MYCTQIIQFDAAHRIIGHQGKCRKLHGHRYVLEATFTADTLNDLNMIIDFATIKAKLKTWIDECWDHNTVLSKADKNLGEAIETHSDQKIYYLDHNPTAEGMASYILYEVCPKLFADEQVKCVAIKLYETPSCYAFANLSEFKIIA